MNSIAHKPIVGEFWSVVDEIYGTYLDSVHGFTTTAKALQKENKKDRERAKEIFSQFPTLAHVDPQVSRSFGRLQQNQDRAMHMHSISYDELLDRNQVGGRNWDSAANTSVVTIYQHWEANFRANIATALGVQPEQLEIPIIGDIRNLRNSILHHLGIAKPAVENSQILNWFKIGDEIKINEF